MSCIWWVEHEEYPSTANKAQEVDGLGELVRSPSVVPNPRDDEPREAEIKTIGFFQEGVERVERKLSLLSRF